MAKSARNSQLAKGVNLHSRGAMFKRRGKFKFVNKGGAKKAAPQKTEQMVGKFVEADDAPVKVSNKRVNRPTKLRESIVPGTVLIVLSGRFRGKRVVFLKQLESGLLLVSGPYKANGVPLRRLNQAYAIATSTTVDISGVKIPAHINDAYFARVQNAKEGEEGFFNTAETINPEWLNARKKDQKEVDTQLLAAVGKQKLLLEYLKAKFTLTKHQAPHLLKF